MTWRRLSPYEPHEERTARNGIERDLTAEGVEIDGIQPVSTAGGDKVISESCETYEIGHTT